MRHIVIEFDRFANIPAAYAADCDSERVARVCFEPSEFDVERIARKLGKLMRATARERKNRPGEYRVYQSTTNLTFAIVRFSRPDEE